MSKIKVEIIEPLRDAAHVINYPPMNAIINGKYLGPWRRGIKYEVRDTIYVGGKIWRCINEHISVESFAANSTDWEDISNYLSGLTGHFEMTNNPHNVTKDQVGLGSVNNWGIASQLEAETGSVNNKYMTPLRTKQYVDLQLAAMGSQIGGGFNEHTTNTNNPHQVTKAQVGLGNVQDFSIASANEARAGTRNDRYMTPLRSKEQLDIHATDITNPHEVTKVQVGLGRVENFPMATTNDAIEGEIEDRYMSPARTKEAIISHVLEATGEIGDHATNVDNPHEVTKEQVGLGEVENFPIASLQEAQEGDAEDRYMTPRTTKEALGVHTERTDNPHEVTKEQVGLGDVVNMPLATNEEALAGHPERYVTAEQAHGVSNAAAANYVSGLASNLGPSGNVVYSTGEEDSPLIGGPLLDKTVKIYENNDFVSGIEVNSSNLGNVYVNSSTRVAYIVSPSADGPILTEETNLTIAFPSGRLFFNDETLITYYVSPSYEFTRVSVDAAASLNSHIDDLDNPHQVTKSQIGLSEVGNFSVATPQESREATSNEKYMTPVRTRDTIMSIVRGSEGEVPFSTNTNIDPGYLLLRTPSIVATEAEATTQRNLAISWEPVFNNWYRFSHNTTENQPANLSELNEWEYDSVNNRVLCTRNSATVIGMVSDFDVEDYVLEVSMTSTNGDDDWIGVVFGFEIDENGREHTLIAWKHTGGNNASPILGVAYNMRSGFSGQISDLDLGSNSNGLTRPGQIGKIGWAANPQGSKIKVTRVGDVFTIETTDTESPDTYIDSAKVVVDLNDYPELEMFKGATRWGYVCHSQAASTWDVIQRPVELNRFAVDETKVIWDWDGSQWNQIDGQYDELVPPGRLYYNEITQKLYYKERLRLIDIKLS